MTRYVALLRGINVGSNRKVPMADLRALFVEAGATDVVTYIQSGNVVFCHTEHPVPELQLDLERRIEATFGFPVPVVMRTRAQLEAVIEHNPFPVGDPTKLSVVFLPEAPPPGAFDHVDLAAVAPERFVVRGEDIYLDLPNGTGRAVLPPRMGKAMAVGTVRNWRTVIKLLDLARS